MSEYRVMTSSGQTMLVAASSQAEAERLAEADGYRVLRKPAHTYGPREQHGGGTDITTLGDYVPGERCVYTWVGNRGHVGTYRNGVRVIFHAATDADRTAMYCGQMSYDPVTCPSSKAWAEHVANGGD